MQDTASVQCLDIFSSYFVPYNYLFHVNLYNSSSSLFSVVLNLSENNITRLDSSSFRGMRMMRRVYFNYNQISNIGRRTFQSLKREVPSSAHQAWYNTFAGVCNFRQDCRLVRAGILHFKYSQEWLSASSKSPRPRQLPSTAACDFGDKYLNLNISDSPNKIKIKFA